MEILLAIILVILLLALALPYILAQLGVHYLRRMGRKMGWTDASAQNADTGKSGKTKQPDNPSSHAGGQKIFADNEGQYVEFEEIKQ